MRLKKIYFITLIFAFSLMLANCYSPQRTVTYEPMSKIYKEKEALKIKEDKSPPRIIITKPNTDGKRGIAVIGSNEPIGIEGFVIDDKVVNKFTINNNIVKILNDGSFKYNVLSPSKNNQYKLVAIDSNFNRAEKTIIIERKELAHTTISPVTKIITKSKPTLWVLSIGISNYKNSSLNLKYADNDAIVFAQSLKRLEGGAFKEVYVNTLINNRATRANIFNSISKHLGKAGPDDVILIFVAGHGTKHIRTGSYYFLTYNADSTNLLYEGLKWSDFDEAIKIISSNVNKVILVVDTCHSGAIKVAMRNVNTGEDLAAKMKAASGLYILSASKGGETSLENQNFRFPDEKTGHGAFTYALLKGLRGEANFDKNSYLTISELFYYVAAQVPRITNGQQHPYSNIQGTDLPIATFE